VQGSFKQVEPRGKKSAGLLDRTGCAVFDWPAAIPAARMFLYLVGRRRQGVCVVP
jgi:hypothetical protein